MGSDANGITNLAGLVGWLLLSWGLFAVSMFATDRALRHVLRSRAGRLLSRDSIFLVQLTLWSGLLVTGMLALWEILL